MRQRTISSVGIVVIGLLPALLGGRVFAVVFTAIAAVAYIEAIAIIRPLPASDSYLGLGLVILAGILATSYTGPHAIAILCTLAVGAPLTATVFLNQTEGLGTWTATTATTLYLALPTFAAIDLRNATEFAAHDWLRSLAGTIPTVPDSSGGGLAWFLLALLVTWLSDTFAYLVGKTWGRHKLLPRVSPNKTVEGSVGGLVAAALTAVLCDLSFGMGIGGPLAIMIGISLGVVGQLGDLAESRLKRMHGVKDSGNLIPGHGGMLDRIDALIFVITASWLIAPIFN